MASAVKTMDTGSSPYLLIRNDTHQIYDYVAADMVTYVSDDYVNYANAATEQGLSGYYYCVIPEGLSVGFYRWEWKLMTGASVSESDPSIALESVYYDGTRWYLAAMPNKIKIFS